MAIAPFAGGLPTFIAVILAWMNSNARIVDMNHDLNCRIDDTSQMLGKRLDDLPDTIRAEGACHQGRTASLGRVMDTWLKHLEERDR
jgi:hypothetical protein